MNPINNSVSILKSGGVILYPTETIWGLGCDATNTAAVSKLLEIKQRPKEKGLVLLVNSPFMVEYYVEKVPEIAWQLIEVSEEPLTIVYPKARNLPKELLSEDGTIAIRITTHQLCKQIITQLRKPLVSTSANISGQKFPAGFKDISESIINSVDFYFDPALHKAGGEKPSSIIKLGYRGEIQIIRK